jgi:hypothetical protein
MLHEIERKYEAAIPVCCRFKTMDEHYDNLALCWSLLAAINNDTPMDCGMCEFAETTTMRNRNGGLVQDEI